MFRKSASNQYTLAGKLGVKEVTMRLILWGTMGAMVASLGVIAIILFGKGTIPNPFGEQGLVVNSDGDAVMSTKDEIIEACAK